MSVSDHPEFLGATLVCFEGRGVEAGERGYAKLSAQLTSCSMWGLHPGVDPGLDLLAIPCPFSYILGPS